MTVLPFDVLTTCRKKMKVEAHGGGHQSYRTTGAFDGLKERSACARDRLRLNKHMAQLLELLRTSDKSDQRSLRIQTSAIRETTQVFGGTSPIAGVKAEGIVLEVEDSAELDTLLRRIE
ncbi:MAG: hypothetical protein Q9212_000226 [Teloschistes hypoglaucus]